MEPTKLQNNDFQEQTKNVSPHHAEGMRRDNESIDDFEHLEPESSPVKEFQGLSSQTKVDKQPILEPEAAPDNGASLVNPIATDYSFLPSSKLEHPTEDQKMGQVGDGNFISSSTTGTLLDSESSLFKSSDLPEKTAFSQPSSNLLADLSYNPDTKQDVHQFFGGEKLQSEFESDLNKLSSQKLLSQSFMDTEREKVLEGPSATSHGDDLNKLMADVDYLKSEKKSNEPDSDPYIHSTDTTSLPEDIKQHDLFLDSDTILEPSKSDIKLKGKATDEFGSSKSSLSAHDDEFHDDIYSQDDKPEKKTEPDVKPSAVEPEHTTSTTIPEPVKQFSSVIEPSLKPEPVPSSIPMQEKLSENPVPPEIPAKSKAVEDDNDLDEIKPIQLFQYMGLDAWFKPDRLHPKVVELVYWRDPKKSGIVFGTVLGILLSLTYFSLISVVAYLSLVLLTGTISFRIYKNVLQAVQKTSDGHPFKEILELDLTLPQDKVREVTDIAVAHMNAAALELRRLFLVEDLVDSIKFGVLLWSLTYVGSWFNGMTLIIIAFVALFTLPKVYENNKSQIDQNLDVVRSKIADITSKVKAAIPIGKKPVAEEEKKDQ